MEDTTKYAIGGLVGGIFIGMGIVAIALYYKVQPIVQFVDGTKEVLSNWAGQATGGA